MIAEIETERARYAFRTSRNEVANQLLEEGMLFRKMHRPSITKRKKPKRIPFPIKV